MNAKTQFNKNLRIVRKLLRTHRPICGAPCCNAEAVTAPIVQEDNSPDVWFLCPEMCGHWVGTQDEVRWILREPEQKQ